MQLLVVVLVVINFAIPAHGWNLKSNNLNGPVTVNSAQKENVFNFLKISSSVLVSSAVLSVPLVAPLVAQAAEDVKKKVKKPKVLETDDGIKYIVLKQGSGAFPGSGDFVAIDYEAFLSDGTMFDSTIGKGKKALSFRYGQKQVIPGIESVLSYMQAGAEVTCTIPANLAYGTKGVCVKDGCVVKPGETLKYFIRLKSLGVGYN